MFSEYLKVKLKENKIDVSVYHAYLIGILEDNIDLDEKRENLIDICSSLIVNELFFSIKKYLNIFVPLPLGI